MQLAYSVSAVRVNADKEPLVPAADKPEPLLSGATVCIPHKNTVVRLPTKRSKIAAMLILKQFDVSATTIGVSFSSKLKRRLRIMNRISVTVISNANYLHDAMADINLVQSSLIRDEKDTLLKRNDLLLLCTDTKSHSR